MKHDEHVRSAKVQYEDPCYIGRATIAGRSEIGAFTYFTGNAHVYGAKIGRYCSIADGVGIGMPEHPTDWFSSHPFAWKYDPRFAGHPIFDTMASPEKYPPNSARTTIGNDVWIGADAKVSKGVTIGDGAIIAAGSIVTKDVNPYAIVMGIPAKLHRMRFEEAVIQRLLKLQWWNYFLDRRILGKIKYSNPINVITEIERAIGNNQLKRLEDTEAHIFQHKIGPHPQSFNETIEILQQAVHIGSDVPDVMEQYGELKEEVTNLEAKIQFLQDRLNNLEKPHTSRSAIQKLWRGIFK